MSRHGRQPLLPKTRILGLRYRLTTNPVQSGVCGRRTHPADGPSRAQVPTPPMSMLIMVFLWHLEELINLSLSRIMAVRIAQLALQSQSYAHPQLHTPKAVKGVLQIRYKQGVNCLRASHHQSAHSLLCTPA